MQGRPQGRGGGAVCKIEGNDAENSSTDRPVDPSMDSSILSICVRQFTHPLLFPSIYRSISRSIHRFMYLPVIPSINLPLMALSLHFSIFPSL